MLVCKKGLAQVCDGFVNEWNHYSDHCLLGFSMRAEGEKMVELPLLLHHENKIKKKKMTVVNWKRLNDREACDKFGKD